MMTFTESLATLADKAYSGIESLVLMVDPGASDLDVIFYLYVATNVVLLATLLYSMFTTVSKTEAEKSRSGAYLRGVETGTETADFRNHGKIANYESIISDQKRSITKLKGDYMELSKLNSDKDEQLERLALAADGSYQRERIIATLARDLEGYDVVEQKAESIVETLR